ncbi:hypothetical protein TRFO_06841 [Tritrichomonas foetus]|uniref:Uncharacterized protein n=1 Tax=Tritrichomonas foetus TaxID=1144522 RepID=A0A1J4K0Z5_9EUKA|nr:hypothetical protein TRFO_06841 [Tritrichomonas foetus]|eukprot:OHT03165.1 hypothetical protein TRFO_06841 [Tritrichomonas foetus]
MEEIQQDEQYEQQEQYDEVEQNEEEDESEPKKQLPPTPFTDRLADSGVIDLLADTLITMYSNLKTAPEIFNFFLTTIGAVEHPDVEKILTENQELRKNIANLKTQIAELEAKARK